MENVINLFEYQNKVVYPGSYDAFEELETFLDVIWKKREKAIFFSGEEEKLIETQRFLQFLHQTREIKSNKYAGVIYYQGQKINLLPKIFFRPESEYSEKQITQVHNHILWWLSYCRKIKFPNYLTLLSGLHHDFFEILIYLFSKYTLDLLNTIIYQQYEEINKEVSYLRGRLDTNRYISNNLSRGRWHKLNCTYDAFVMDNKFNRIIKYVTSFLFHVSTVQENKKKLREILFILDEVSEQKSTAEECASIRFNPVFSDFETVRDYCYLFLSNSISFDYKKELKLFAFLLPMEYVFEDFIYGFIDKEIPKIKAVSQKSDTYLDESHTFRIIPDLFIQAQGKSLIADTKYKIIYSDDNDPQKGISQQDLYQMLAYAIRLKVNEIILLYPGTIRKRRETTIFFIRDKFAGKKEIIIKIYQLSIIDPEVLENPPETTYTLDDLFDPLKVRLIKELENIFL